MILRQPLLAIAGATLSVVPAMAQDVVDAGKIVIDNWSYDSLYASDAWSVDALFGREVTGSEGEPIGDVEDLVLSDEGEVVALITEVGGFWDIGDTHVSVPWDMVKFDAGGSVAVPVTQENYFDFDLFASSGLPEGASVEGQIVEGVDDRELASGLWRASELIGDYVRVQGEDDLWVNFGYVSDLMVDDGQITTTLVSTTARYGPRTYAYPYRTDSMAGQGAWAPEAATYDLPILLGDAIAVPPYDADRMQSN